MAMQVDYDATGLQSERNVLRRRPLRRIALISGDDASGDDLTFVAAAAATVGAVVHDAAIELCR